MVGKKETDAVWERQLRGPLRRSQCSCLSQNRLCEQLFILKLLKYDHGTI